jgi:hypothetical protein
MEAEMLDNTQGKNRCIGKLLLKTYQAVPHPVWSMREFFTWPDQHRKNNLGSAGIP